MTNLSITSFRCIGTCNNMIYTAGVLCIPKTLQTIYPRCAYYNVSYTNVGLF